MPEAQPSDNLRSVRYAGALPASSASHNAICPRCRQRAPIVLRGVEAFCAACGAHRIPFTARSLNLAGKGSRIGGAAARFLGWVSLIGGTTTAAFVALVVQSFWPDGFVGYALALPILVISLAIGIPLLIGGSRLGKRGAARERATQLEAIRSMAAHRGGVITAKQVAEVLKLPEATADDMLTELAKLPDEKVGLDVDDDGNLFYLFGMDDEELSEARWRIANPNFDPRIAAEQEAAAYEEAMREQQRSQR